MAKNIIICSDGTGNTAIKERGTNVFKLFEAVDLNGHRDDPDHTKQVAIYHDGVGTESLKWLSIFSGAFGWGLSRHVKELYASLARVYEPGDRIFLFGFSRGAFTVRTLAGLIGDCGIVKGAGKTNDELWKAVEKAYKLHRRKYRSVIDRTLQTIKLQKRFTDDLASQLRQEQAVKDEEHARDGEVRIAFIGVWDTVDAVGFPIAHVADFINTCIYQFKFPDTKLSSRVDRACHALSIDDERHTFHPLVWNEKDERNQRIEQVWFAGVHSNVGGGYPKQGLSLVSLDWMMSKAEESGLRFIKSDRDWYREHRNVHDYLYDSRGGLAMYYRYKPRDILQICDDNGIVPKIHTTAFERLIRATDGYAPGNLPITDKIWVVSEESAEPAQKELRELFSEVPESDRPLHKAKRFVEFRKHAHHVLVLLTLALFAAYSLEQWLERRPLEFSGLKPLKHIFTHWSSPEPYLAIFLAVAVGAGWKVARRMNETCSRFWNHRRELLKRTFHF